ncbi:MAG: 50S ribosomal protein L14e [Candidatus Diapherotrites archaeon]|nr:50S ribosomal protein L14e [Candidatus Diapherotrites archaeon]
MGAYDIGRICLKTAGRHAGKKVVIVSELEENKFVTIDGKGIKRKRCNVAHLEPLNETLNVTKSTSHDEITKMMK